MTVAQMHPSFRFGMDKLDSVNYPNFLTEEIDLLLNQAQERFVKQRYGVTNMKHTSFEETQKRTEDLKELIRDITITPIAFSVSNISSKALFYNLPADHWFTIQERIIQTCDKCNDFTMYEEVPQGDGSVELVLRNVKYAEVRPIQHLEFDKIINDAFKAPDYDKVIRLMYENKSEIITATYCRSLFYKMRYIKKPVTIDFTTSTDCELSEHTHQEIVDMAIQIALEGIEAKRNGTFTPIINNTNE
jgi:hypothetical protein